MVRDLGNSVTKPETICADSQTVLKATKSSDMKNQKPFLIAGKSS